MIGWFLFAIIVLGLCYLYLQKRNKKQLKKLLLNYDEKTNKSRSGKNLTDGSSKRVGELKEREQSVERFSEPERRQLLPTTDVDVIGKDSISKREPSRKFKGIFRKLRR